MAGPARVAAAAVKWGIAGLPLATHALVAARLWLPAAAAGSDLQDCGLRTFLVRLRQQESGEALPGVSMGECPAPPAAPPTAALGWLRLSGVRVPRAPQRPLQLWSTRVGKG